MHGMSVRLQCLVLTYAIAGAAAASGCGSPDTPAGADLGTATRDASFTTSESDATTLETGDALAEASVTNPPSVGTSDGGWSEAAVGRADAGADAGSVTPPSHTPVDRIPVRVHMAQSMLTNADLMPILAEANKIWFTQAGICFEFEVTNDETNITRGFDVRYESGAIPGAATANGLTVNEHLVYVKDHPSLGPAPNPAQNPAARTTAHELGHALNLQHENAPPSTDCATPCYCVTLGLMCQDFLMGSGTLGFFVSDPEVRIARTRAQQVALVDTTPLACDPPAYNR